MGTVLSSCYKPKERGLDPRGDDAHYINNAKQTIGVADGVGSRTNLERGLDPRGDDAHYINNAKQTIDVADGVGSRANLERGLDRRGDDAHYINNAKQTIGVADGVGSRTNLDILDAEESARILMNKCWIAIEDEPKGALDPISVLNKAYSRTDTIKTLVSTEKRMKMVSGSFYIPKEGGLHPQGDDAHFIRDDKKTIGVADGVGGWAKLGVDAGEYARQLMSNSVIALEKDSEGAVDPVRVLNEAYSNTDAKGTSTACIITITDQCLHVVNIGDSGFILIREGEIIFRSQIQQHASNNRPYQLGNYIGADRPNSAQVFKVDVKPGDVIVAGTDGLFDNMYENDIKMFVEMGIEENMDPEQVAWAIAEYTFHISVDKEARDARRAKRIRCGGKKDDITVVVSYVFPPDDSEEHDN